MENNNEIIENSEEVMETATEESLRQVPSNSVSVQLLSLD